MPKVMKMLRSPAAWAPRPTAPTSILTRSRPSIGSLLAAEGKLTFLRVHDVGTRFGPPIDFIDVEVVVRLDSEPRKAFGFQLRNDANEGARRRMLDLLRDAFRTARRVRVEYVRTGLLHGRIIRVIDLP